jgi:ribonuclease P protein component
MIPRLQRLTGPRVKYLLKKGHKRENNYVIFKHLPTSKPFSRFCVIISTKTASLAVKRNLFRRRIYEAFRRNQNLLSSHYDVICIIKTPCLDLNYQQINQMIIQFFQNLK